MNTSFKILLALAAAAALSGCFGGGDSNETPPPGRAEVPASALVSTTAWVNYTASLPVSESGAPVEVNNANPPTSESEAPKQI